ncbi:hypothetical protein F5J12DRAFT_905067 [Pisolithus orientalis]|uniref:uncharacterized protein n=1 Tax=Pisolithus orientalis TaxID=936130 RepID=UPI002224C0EB|nr:uncharacterized protein F5J12DRAFT_905067 [Pisolithus orientalis]KAI6009526.1 hypothetical protein F5J12DRAFT_905067 [Pisolithus orientalis]
MAIQPDFTTEEYQEAHLQLINDAVDNQQATNILATLWNKTKHALICKVGVPLGSVNIPSPYAACKLKKGKYCKLYFFTNIGLAEAETFNPSIDDEALTLLKVDNGQHIWVPASTTRDKLSVIKDEDLTWEQFGEASMCLISMMKEHDWEEERSATPLPEPAETEMASCPIDS